MVEDALKIPDAEKDTLPASKSETPFVPKPHHKAKGPNPLSMKKKKQPKSPSTVPSKMVSEPSHPEDSGLKRKRDETDAADNENVPKKKKQRRRKPAEQATDGPAAGSS